MPDRREFDPMPAALLEERVRGWAAQELSATRHALRGDIAALGAQITSLVLTSTREHAGVKADVDALKAQVEATTATVAGLAEDVQALKVADVADHAAQEATKRLRSSLWKQTTALAGLIVACAGIIVTMH